MTRIVLSADAPSDGDSSGYGSGRRGWRVFAFQGPPSKASASAAAPGVEPRGPYKKTTA